MGKPRIAFAIWDIGNVGGAQRVIGLVANALCADFEVHIVNLYGYPEKRGPSIPIDPRVTVSYLGKGTMPRLRKTIVQSFNPLRKYLKQNQIDVCLLQTTDMGIIAAPVVLWNRLFGGKNRCKFVFHDHGALAAQLSQKDITTIRMVSARLCDRTVVLTKRSAADYQKFLKIPRRKLAVITNWIDPEINPEDVQADISAKRIIWAGRLSAEKGSLRIPEIAKEIFPNFPDWQWDIFGDGAEREVLEKKIGEYGLENQVFLRGKTAHLYEEFPKYSIGTLTSDMEGMSMFLLEATAFSLPCVSFDVVTGPNEIIADGQSGFLVKPFDTHRYALKIQQLMASQELRESFSQRQETVKEQFSMQKIAPLWRRFLSKLTR